MKKIMLLLLFATIFCSGLFANHKGLLIINDTGKQIFNSHLKYDDKTIELTIGRNQTYYFDKKI